MKNEINTLCDNYIKKWIEARRHFHKYPEIADNEFNTSEFIYNYLKELGLEVQKLCTTGVVGILKGRLEGKTIAVRADMDALCIEEQNNFDFKSVVPGVMHACGHDIHMASVIGCAEVLSHMKEKINGTVKFIFQPSEEIGMGAKRLIDAGVLENPKVDAIIGGHVWPGVKAETVEIVPGPIMASPDAFEIVVEGRGGHGSQPHLTIDPIPIASEIILALQLLVSRLNNPLKPLVVTIGSIHGGNSYNVIPDDIVMKGTVRTLDKDLGEKIPIQMEKCVKGITEICGAKYRFKYEKKNPVTVNDENMAKMMAEAARNIIGDDKVVIGHNPSMAGEDFAFYAQKIPACFIRIGITADESTKVPLHNAHFNAHESSIKTAAATYCQTVIDYLNI